MVLHPRMMFIHAFEARMLRPEEVLVFQTFMVGVVRRESSIESRVHRVLIARVQVRDCCVGRGVLTMNGMLMGSIVLIMLTGQNTVITSTWSQDDLRVERR